MNKKGFTLVELLATIAILSLVIAIGVISYNAVDASARKETRNNLIKKIEIAASKYAFNTNNTCVKISTLISKGYLDADENDKIIDPVDNSELNDYYVEMTKVGNYYNATFKNSTPPSTCK